MAQADASTQTGAAQEEAAAPPPLAEGEWQCFLCGTFRVRPPSLQSRLGSDPSSQAPSAALATINAHLDACMGGRPASAPAGGAVVVKAAPKAARRPSVRDGLASFLTGAGPATESAESKAPAPKRSQLPLPVFRLMKDRDLVKWCKDRNVPAAANKVAMKRRITAVVNLYNAESDSLRPRSLQQCVVEVMRRERAERQNSCEQPADISAWLATSSKSTAEEMQRARRRYLAATRSELV